MTKFQIEAPVRNFSGEVVGVAFQKGTGYVENLTDEGRAALAYFRRQEYGVAEAPEKSMAEAVMDLVTGPDGGYDPGKQSVEDVIAYLGGADAAEAARVLDAEAAGKNRVSITKQREAILASKTTQSDPATAPAADDQKGPQA